MSVTPTSPYRRAAMLTPAERATIRGLWADPAVTSVWVAAEATRLLGRPVSDRSARDYRPGSGRRPDRGSPAPHRVMTARPDPKPKRPRGRRRGPLAGWIAAHRAVARRLGLSRWITPRGDRPCEPN